MEDHVFIQRLGEMTETLYRVCYAQLPRACDREDAVQECLLRAWRSRAQLREPDYLQTWVCRILLNVCYDLRKRTPSHDELTDPASLTHLPDPSSDPAGIPEGALPELHDALLALPETLRLPLVLHYLEGFRLTEVAQILDLPLGTVKSRMQRARARLSDLLKGQRP